MHICTTFLRQRHVYSAYAAEQKQWLCSADPAQAGTLHGEAELGLYQTAAAIFSVFLDQFALSTVGMRFRLQQLLYVCISGQLVSHTSKRSFSVLSSTVSEKHEPLQQSKPGEQGIFTFFSQEDKTKSLLSKSHCEFQVLIGSDSPYGLLSV